ncbi:hypothetical protein KSP39_PZI017864 [Platanthera zijinensis]|uniref:Fe2OG dioxygenase domain-containing protein n=1 Tax=Platanthera zijinensis TaxID=2320716 RepID=A0AAP0G096_9ASPA
MGSLFNPSLNKVSQSSSSYVSNRSTSSQSVERQQKLTSENTIGASPERDPRSKPEKGSFDIFRTTNVGLPKLNKPLHVLNKEKKKDFERFKNAPEPQYLRSGMVLLKKFINTADQVKVLNKCRELGIGSGGFYRPGYSNGTKLHLQMMCLGKDWDPDSKLYKDSRLFDDVVPPEIPGEFKILVDGALHTAHNFLRRSSRSVEEIPNMSPDVCIVNFYDNSGKLGLHQDIDESRESLAKELPVVSFSVGDSAEFLYGDVRDADKAGKVILDSGDVLIFGGKSRLIFHGVASIKPNTAPAFLINETAVRPGRLNLTFRQV